MDDIAFKLSAFVTENLTIILDHLKITFSSNRLIQYRIQFFVVSNITNVALNTTSSLISILFDLTNKLSFYLDLTYKLILLL
jgi:hypothetical protein